MLSAHENIPKRIIILMDIGQERPGTAVRVEVLKL